MWTSSHDINQKSVVLSMKQGHKKMTNSPQKGKHTQRQEQIKLKKEKKIVKRKNAGRPSKKNNNNKNIEQMAYNSQQENFQTTNIIQDKFKDIYDNIIMLLIDFFEHTNQKKGFVYNKDVRLKLQKNRDDILKESRWVMAQQKNKALLKIREIFSQSLGNLQEKLMNILVQTSGIFSQQFTQEYYTIVLEVFRLILSQKNIGNKDMSSYINLANDIHMNVEGRYVFFSYAFREGIKFCIKDDFTKPENDTPYRELIKGLRQQLQFFD